MDWETSQVGKDSYEKTSVEKHKGKDLNGEQTGLDKVGEEKSSGEKIGLI